VWCPTQFEPQRPLSGNEARKPRLGLGGVNSGRTRGSRGVGVGMKALVIGRDGCTLRWPGAWRESRVTALYTLPAITAAICWAPPRI